MWVEVRGSLLQRIGESGEDEADSSQVNEPQTASKVHPEPDARLPCLNKRTRHSPAMNSDRTSSRASRARQCKAAIESALPPRQEAIVGAVTASRYRDDSPDADISAASAIVKLVIGSQLSNWNLIMALI